MPFLSKKQMRLFAEKVKRGEMKQDTYDKWVKETPNSHALPEQAGSTKGPMIKQIKTKKVK